jgi:hypothetical protein
MSTKHLSLRYTETLPVYVEIVNNQPESIENIGLLTECNTPLVLHLTKYRKYNDISCTLVNILSSEILLHQIHTSLPTEI